MNCAPHCLLSAPSWGSETFEEFTEADGRISAQIISVFIILFVVLQVAIIIVSDAIGLLSGRHSGYLLTQRKYRVPRRSF